MQLSMLLEDFAVIQEDTEVPGLSCDTRTLCPGEVFFALAGPEGNSFHYVAQAIAKGASAIVYDPLRVNSEHFSETDACRLIAIENLYLHLGDIAARFYGQPSDTIQIIGITGTNGKTSCSQFLGQLLQHCAIVGTLGWGRWGQLTMTGYTTPDALMTQRLLAECQKLKCSTVAMEVSSHGIAEHRIAGIRFHGAVLTNISRDHLDYHGSMAAYIDTKKRLFARSELQFAVINLDDALSEEFIAVVAPQTKIWGYVVNQKLPVANIDELIYTENIVHHSNGLTFDVCWREQRATLYSPLYGSFNIENLLAVISVMLALDYSLNEIANRLALLKPVNGRMQRLGDQESALIFVDYAHTPDALEKALASARLHCQRELWVVFGCGGDRDTGKRAEMGKFAEAYADHLIITDDNPRSEEPGRIVQDILSGCRSKDITVIHDRKEAIFQAVTQANKEDCVLIAGKGHEQYQEYQNQKLPFCDVDVVMQALSSRSFH